MEANLIKVDKNEDTRVIANQNGKMVQIPADQFGGGSGVVVVAFEMDSEDGTITASMSPAEVKAAMKTSPVIATVAFSGDTEEIFGVGSFSIDVELNPCIIWGLELEPSIFIYVSEDAWATNRA